jgi:hypothetical protein
VDAPTADQCTYTDPGNSWRDNFALEDVCGAHARAPSSPWHCSSAVAASM